MDEILPKLLIIDDEEDLAQMLADFLEGEFTTTVVTNPILGLNILKENQFDLIISDLHMPQVSGYEIISQAQKCQPKTPIIVMTGNGRDDPATKNALEMGAKDVVVKPFSGLNNLLIQLKNTMSSS